MTDARVTGNRVTLPLPGRLRSAFHVVGGALFVCGLVAAIGRDHPILVVSAWTVAGLVGVVVAVRVNRAAIMLDPDRLILRGVLVTRTFAKGEIADAVVEAPQWSISGPWYLTRGWQEGALLLTDGLRIPIARLPAGRRDGFRPELDRLARTILAWRG